MATADNATFEFDREAVIRRCQGLMAKTTAAGCTEQEAMAAADALKRLLDKYELQLVDLKAKDRTFARDFLDSQQKKKTGMHHLVSGVGDFCDCKAWYDMQGAFGGIRYWFFGFEDDVMMAKFLLKILDGAIVRSREEYKEANRAWYRQLSGKQKTDTISEFEMSMGDRIAQRLRGMKEMQRQENIATTGRDLVVIKGPLVQEALSKTELIFRKEKHGYKYRLGSAFKQGRTQATKSIFQAVATTATAVNLNMKRRRS